eukprot:COSAG02_NODE_1854_length_10652_cov_27.298209_8_plen_162_part_00
MAAREGRSRGLPRGTGLLRCACRTSRGKEASAPNGEAREWRLLVELELTAKEEPWPEEPCSVPVASVRGSLLLLLLLPLGCSCRPTRLLSEERMSLNISSIPSQDQSHGDCRRLGAHYRDFPYGSSKTEVTTGWLRIVCASQDQSHGDCRRLGAHYRDFAN